MSTVKRKRLNLSSWREVLRRFDAASTSVHAFCAAEGLSTTSFYRWRDRLQNETAGPATPARARHAVPTAQRAAGFVDLGSVFNGGGIELRLDLGGGVLLTLARR